MLHWHILPTGSALICISFYLYDVHGKCCLATNEAKLNNVEDISRIEMFIITDSLICVIVARDNILPEIFVKIFIVIIINYV